MANFVRQSDIDWNKPQQDIYNLTHLSGFKNRKERRATRQWLNTNPNAIIYDGASFYRASDLGHPWSRKDMRQMARTSDDKWNYMYGHMDSEGRIHEIDDEGNKIIKPNRFSNQIIGAHNLAGKARIMQWNPITEKTQTNIPFSLPLYTNTDWYRQIIDDKMNDMINYFSDRTVNPFSYNGPIAPKYEPSFMEMTTYRPVFQQGGQLQSQTQSDPTEDMLRNAIFGYLGAKDDITSDKALQTVVSAFIQNPESIKEIASNKEMVNRGKKKMQVEDQQNNTQMLQQIMQPGALIQLVNQLVKNNQQTQVAKMGTKLDYIKGLKPFYCPEGQEIAFMKLGSKVCPVCKKAHAKNTPHKAEDGEKIEKECGGGVSKMMKGIKAAMKCGGKMKKKMAEGGETEDNTTYTVQQRDSLINAFNKNPNMDTYRKIQRANRTVSDEEDQKKHPQINRDALARLLRGKSK